MLTNEDKFLHAVAVLFIPVVGYSLVLLEEILKLSLWHCGIPLTGVAQSYLASSLFEDVTSLLLILKIADSLATDDGLRPLLGNPFVELR